jgi:hypothetical protein
MTTPDPSEFDGLEARLAAAPIPPPVAPVDDRAARDRLMFRAGQAAARAAMDQGPGATQRPSRFVRILWPSAVASLGALALVEGLVLAHRPEPTVQIVEHVVMVPVPDDDKPTLPVAPPPAPAPAVASDVWSPWPLLLGPAPRPRRSRATGLHDLPDLRPVELARSPDSSVAGSTAAALLNAEIQRLQSPGGDTL